MSITDYNYGWPGVTDNIPGVLFLNTNDTLATVTTSSTSGGYTYLNSLIKNKLADIIPSGNPSNTTGTLAIVNTSDAGTVPLTFNVSGTSTNYTYSLTSPATSSEVLINSTLVLPTIVDVNKNNILTTTTTSSAVNYLSLTNAASGSSPTLSAAGTGSNVGLNFVSKGTGAFTASNSTSSTSPTTIRALIGSMTGTGTVMTSGNLVGAIGQVTLVGASGGYLYGVEGKVIPSGTLSGSSWTAGVFGQLDISNATINAGQTATLWGDYGATSHTLTSTTGMYGIAMTNTTAAVLAGQIYLYGGATNLLLLSTNGGVVGATYFKTAGTSAGSAGDTSKCNATKVLTISVDSTTYYIPLFAQNT